MFERYKRQTILPEVLEEGQKNLTSSKILVAGAGGLASSALQYLVGAGCGNITIYDEDNVSETNLHRQTIYNEKHIGLPKVKVAKNVLINLNSNCNIFAIQKKINAKNAPNIIQNHDLIIDCGDNFALSYILSDICYMEKKPLISASALRFEGYVGGFCGGMPSLRAVFPDLPDNIENCNTAGVIGSVVGTIGSIQAQMAINYFLKISPSPLGQIISIDLKNYHFSSFRFDKAKEPKESNFKFIDPSQISKTDLVIELRNTDEKPDLICFNSIRVDFTKLEEKIMQLDKNKHLVFVCKSGIRSWKAAKMFEHVWNNKISLIADNYNEE